MGANLSLAIDIKCYDLSTVDSRFPGQYRSDHKLSAIWEYPQFFSYFKAWIKWMMHDGVMKCKRFHHHWPFSWGEGSHQRRKWSVMHSLDVFFVLCWKTLEQIYIYAYVASMLTSEAVCQATKAHLWCVRMCNENSMLIKMVYLHFLRLLHSPNLVVIGLSVGYDIGTQLASITLLWLAGLNINWDCFVSHYIGGSRGRWEFRLFFRPPWQSICTDMPLPFGPSKGTVNESNIIIPNRFLTVSVCHRSIHIATHRLYFRCVDQNKANQF